VARYERQVAELEQLVGKKEVEIALLKNFGSSSNFVESSKGNRSVSETSLLQRSPELSPV